MSVSRALLLSCVLAMLLCCVYGQQASSAPSLVVDDGAGADAPVPIPTKLHRRHGSTGVLEYSIATDGLSIMVPSGVSKLPSMLYQLAPSATVDTLLNSEFPMALIKAAGKPTNLGAPKCRIALAGVSKKAIQASKPKSLVKKTSKKSAPTKKKATPKKAKKTTTAKKTKKSSRFQQLVLAVEQRGDSRNLAGLLRKYPNQMRLRCTYKATSSGRSGSLYYTFSSFDALFPDTVSRIKAFDKAIEKSTIAANNKQAKSLISMEAVATLEGESQDLPDPLKMFSELDAPVDPSSYYNTNELATPAVSALYPYGGLSYANLLTWGTTYIDAISVFKTPRKYPTWKAAGKTGRFNAFTGAELTGGAPAAGNRMVRIGLAADWGSGTVESDYVAQLMYKDKPDWTMHVGDIYWAGVKEDIRTNCLGYRRRSKSIAQPRGVFWPSGRLGAFASLGNHEMYNRGDGFFDDFLPNLGVRSNGKMLGQKGGYVAVETDKWIVILADTGYKSYAKFNVDAKPDDTVLTPEQIDWLKNDVKIGSANRGIVFMTHHQPVSAFSNTFVGPAKQLAAMLPAGRKFVWLFGHEHILAFYTYQTISNGVGYWGRCVGNGGFPTNVIPNPTKPLGNLIAYDNRLYQHYDEPVDANKQWGDKGYDKTFNGWVDLQIDGSKLIVTYKTFGMAQDSKGKWWASNTKSTSLAREVFTVDANGQVSNTTPLEDADPSDTADLTRVKVIR